jgi:hypothetical protein
MTVYSPAVPPIEQNEDTPSGDRIIGGFAIRDMSPADANAALAEMQKAYVRNKPVLDKFDPNSIRGMSKDEAGALLAEMSGRPLDAFGKPIPLPPREVISSAELQERRNAEFFNDLENRNFPARGTPVGDDLWNMMEGRSPVSPELQKATEAKLKSMQADPEWRKKLLAGDQEAERQFHVATAIITAGKMQRPGEQLQW